MEDDVGKCERIDDHVTESLFNKLEGPPSIRPVVMHDGEARDQQRPRRGSGIAGLVWAGVLVGLLAGAGLRMAYGTPDAPAASVRAAEANAPAVAAPRLAMAPVQLDDDIAVADAVEDIASEPAAPSSKAANGSQRRAATAREPSTQRRPQPASGTAADVYAKLESPEPLSTLVAAHNERGRVVRSPQLEAEAKRRFDIGINKAELLPKAANGTATASELRTLRAICMVQGDRTCRELTTNRLRALSPG